MGAEGRGGGRLIERAADAQIGDDAARRVQSLREQDTVTHEAHAYRDALAVDFTDRAKVLRARHRVT